MIRDCAKKIQDGKIWLGLFPFRTKMTLKFTSWCLFGGWSKAKMGLQYFRSDHESSVVYTHRRNVETFETAPPTYHLQWPSLWLTPHMIYLSWITHHHTSNRSNPMHWLMEQKHKCQQRNHAMTLTPVRKMWLSVFISGKNITCFHLKSHFKAQDPFSNNWWCKGNQM